MIQRVNTKEVIPTIMEMAKNVNGMPLTQLQLLLRDTIELDRAFVLLDDSRYSYTFDTVYNEVRCAYIFSFYAESGAKEMLSMIEDWARSRGIDDMYMSTKRSPDAIQKRFGFEVDWCIMKKKTKED